MSGSAPYTNQGPYSPQEGHGSDNPPYPPQGSPYGPPPSNQHASWGYSAPPSDRHYGSSNIHSFHNRSSNSDTPGNWQSQPATTEVYREWASEDGHYRPVDNYDQDVDPALRTPSTSTSEGRAAETPWPQSSAYSSTAQDTEDGEPSYGQAPFQQESSYTPYTQDSPQNHSTLSVAPLPRHSFTRALVGPLSANACRLLDEHRKPGIFFLFQDLSVRIEGPFVLAFSALADPYSQISPSF